MKVTNKLSTPFLRHIGIYTNFNIESISMNSRITSAQNSRIKHILSLDKFRERKKHNQFTIEGIRELSLAIAAKYSIDSVLYCDEIIDANQVLALGLDESILTPVNRSVFEKIAYRESTGGVVAIAKPRPNTLAQIQLKHNPLILVLEAVEKPGNLGAMLRTADAAGVDAVICCDPQTDFYNSNVIRSSIGCVFTNQIASASSKETIDWLKSNGIRVFCTYLSGASIYTDISYNQPCAIILGSEANGLSDLWIENAEANILIPMRGKINSMNVSVAAAVVLFEAVRQRG